MIAKAVNQYQWVFREVPVSLKIMIGEPAERSLFFGFCFLDLPHIQSALVQQDFMRIAFAVKNLVYCVVDCFLSSV
jgi:hypothetical protein